VTVVLAITLAAAAASAQSAHIESPRVPTYSKDVAPIFDAHCVACHRAGEVGPMPLTTYGEVRPWVRAIRAQVIKGAMPPWFADGAHGVFRNDRRLDAAAIDTITRWIDGGAPRGDDPRAPSRAFADGWRIGEPDLVLEMSEPFDVPARGAIDYQYFVIPTNVRDDVWVQSVEIRPGDRRHLHHAVLLVVESAADDRPAVMTTKPVGARAIPPRPTARPIAERVPAARVNPPILFADYTPGRDPTIMAPGTAKRIRAGSIFVLQNHYSTDGVPGRDRTRVGFVLSKAAKHDEVRAAFAGNAQFLIPAGASNHLVEAEATFSERVSVWAFHPHMHLRGKDMTFTVTYPDGRTEVVLSVPHYDPAWQTEYWLERPLELPAGSRVRVSAHFDNSPSNRRNPDPSIDVPPGEQTWDEMMVGWIHYTAPGDSPRY
jgi:mono/diheme cytochrome c family protein